MVIFVVRKKIQIIFKTTYFKTFLLVIMLKSQGKEKQFLFKAKPFFPFIEKCFFLNYVLNSTYIKQPYKFTSFKS